METITPDTLHLFRPTYPEYHRRRIKTAENVGVESAEDLKDFRAEIERWNAESAIGFRKQETNILALILSEEEGNRRFDNNRFIDPDFGGNTAEHPIFIGHKNDAVRDAAGFAPHMFREDAKTLASAKLSQMLHARAAVHDIGELIDISFTEQQITKASSKEPPEEALVGPFKIRLAAYAISQRDPMLYIHTMYDARKRIQAKKKELFEQARDGQITGDAFVAGVGSEIKTILDSTASRLGLEKGMQDTMRPEYREAAASLTTLFDASQDLNGFEGAMFNLMDKIEGDAHYRHFIGRPSAPLPASAGVLERLFNGGRAVNYHLASSDQVIGSITYAQKTIPPVLKEAHDLPAGPERDVALAYARAGVAMMLRNHIRILQKAPPMIDVTRGDKACAVRTDDVGLQQEEFARRIEMQRTLRDQWKVERKSHGRAPVMSIEGVVDTATLIAVFEKAASVIEQGKYLPGKTDLPIGLGTLPAVLHVTHADIVDSCKKHPMEKHPAYAAVGGAVRL